MFDLNKPLDRVHLTRGLYNLVDIMKEEGPADTLREVVDYKEAVEKALKAGMKSLNTKRGPGDDEGGGSKRQKTDGNTTTGGGKFMFKSVIRHMLTINRRTKYERRNGQRRCAQVGRLRRGSRCHLGWWRRNFSATPSEARFANNMIRPTHAHFTAPGPYSSCV
jgi:hypothetical protein